MSSTHCPLLIRHIVSEWCGNKGNRQQCVCLREGHHQHLEMCTAGARGCHNDHPASQRCSESNKRSSGHSNSGLVQKCRPFVAVLMETTTLAVFLGNSLLWPNKDCSAWNLLPGMKMLFFPKKCWCVAKRWACSSQEIFGELGEFFLMVAPLAEMLLSRGMAFPCGDLTAASACPCLVMTFRDVPKQRTALKDQALTRLTFLSSKS